MAMPVSAMVRKFRPEFERVMDEASERISVVQAPAEVLGAAT
jgi:hypothetical protein